MITKEVLARALPPNLKSAATDALVDAINQISNDPIIAENIRENFLSYSGVLRDGLPECSGLLQLQADG